MGNKGKLSKMWSPSPPPPRYERLTGGDDASSHGKARKGYVPVMVMVGKGENGVAGERFLIPAKFIGHPSIAALLELSRNEFGYEQEGVLRIPCHPDCFREIIKHLPFKIF